MFNIENIRDFFTILGIILVPAGWIYNQYQKRILDQYLRSCFMISVDKFSRKQ